MPRPRSGTTCSSRTPPSCGCCPGGVARRSIRPSPPPEVAMNDRIIASLSALALVLAAAPAMAADYVQAPGSTLAFGGMYQGEAFSGRLPGFVTRLSFDPADPASGRLDVTILMARATTANPDYDSEMRGEAF